MLQINVFFFHYQFLNLTAKKILHIQRQILKGIQEK